MSNVLLSVKNLSLMTDMHSILRNISFDLQSGENIIFFGLENSGIDKICPLLSGLEENYEGEIFFRGKLIRNADNVEKNLMRREMVYLQRGYGLISNMTVYDNIALPLMYHSSFSREKIDDRVEFLIYEMGLDLCRDLRPVDLNNSEMLKTAYARAISLDPELLLIEHPLEAQCVLNVVSFLNSFRSWVSSPLKSTVMITYAPNVFIDIADRFVMLYRGKVVYDGGREDFIQTDNEYVIQYLNYSTKGPMLV